MLKKYQDLLAKAREVFMFYINFFFPFVRF